MKENHVSCKIKNKKRAKKESCYHATQKNYNDLLKIEPFYGETLNKLPIFVFFSKHVAKELNKETENSIIKRPVLKKDENKVIISKHSWQIARKYLQYHRRSAVSKRKNSFLSMNC